WRIIRVHDRAENSDVGDDLLQNAEPFLLHRVAQNDRPSHVIAGTIQALNKASFDRIATCIEDNRNICCRLLRRASGSVSASRHQHSHAFLHKLCGKRWEAAVITVGPAILNVYVLTASEPTFAESFVKCC